jgi:hypothetical protein
MTRGDYSLKIKKSEVTRYIKYSKLIYQILENPLKENVWNKQFQNTQSQVSVTNLEKLKMESVV